jgi:hypothetical protein
VTVDPELFNILNCNVELSLFAGIKTSDVVPDEFVTSIALVLTPKLTPPPEMLLTPLVVTL